ncbi:DUF3806 domain-containing protein [Oceanicoccus sp. KOV_DT_Chl]|uniref:DUF3806 domain-containing protein n=1 Tax=Oceanicoccus sp. KOV_DT_Chl TaxID=1904639 RepID=UPI001F2ED806|nr:DUF3806 domain-containing protein [Oceanicoccus sp. KOV_DT_Chl]
MRTWLFIVLLSVCNTSLLAQVLNPEAWRSEPLTYNDQVYMQRQHDSIDALARRHFGRQLNGKKDNDFAVMQRLLDENIVGAEQVTELQAMGIILGQLLKAEKGLIWVIYTDKYGRSRALQVPGIDKEFIFPATQISRKAEVGIRVDVRQVYATLLQAVTDIRNKPPF